MKEFVLCECGWKTLFRRFMGMEFRVGRYAFRFEILRRMTFEEEKKSGVNRPTHVWSKETSFEYYNAQE